jgi:hypothetical protein
MCETRISRREFVAGGVALAGLGLSLGSTTGLVVAAQERAADYMLHIKNAAIEIAPKRIISAITYNGQSPGPLLRFREGRATTEAVFNDNPSSIGNPAISGPIGLGFRVPMLVISPFSRGGFVAPIFLITLRFCDFWRRASVRKCPI